MDHITEIEAMYNQLNDLGCAVSEIQLITKVICSLPPSFKQAVFAWKYVDDSKKTMPLLTQRLLEAESFNKFHDPGESTADSAFFARRSEANPEEGKASGQSRKKVVCSYCQKNGPSEDRCWKKQKRESREAAPPPAQAGVAQACSESVWPNDYAFTSFSFLSISNRNINDWYVDSGASQHMSDQRWMFSSFYPVHPGSWPVKGIGSDADTLQAAGFGDIHVRVRVNEEWHDGVFSKVLFVPNLEANLFSVGAAASRGVTVSFVGEKVIIARGRKTIAVGASRNRKLYILDAVSKGSGPRLTQAPAISLLSRTVAEPVDLWHHRLGHVYSAVI